MAGDLTWLAQVREDIIDPSQRICDPHHHLWDYPTSRYLLDEILADIGDGHNVLKTVFVECDAMYKQDAEPAMKPVGETEFVQGIAAMSASGQYGPARVADGIVGFADLTLGDDVGPVLAAHIIAGHGRFRGIRHAAGWHEDEAVRNSHSNPTPQLMLDKTFQQGFAQLSEFNLSFDAWCYHHQLSEFVQLAQTFPETTIVLDHFGGPLGIGPFADQRDMVFRDWQKSVEPLANLDNVFFKLGGLNMKVNGFGWHNNPKPPTSDELLEATGHYYRHCLETFGVDRCMFESNFPVDKASCSYHVLFNMFKKLVAVRSDIEKDKLFYQNACRVYRLE